MRLSFPPRQAPTRNDEAPERGLGPVRNSSAAVTFYYLLIGAGIRYRLLQFSVTRTG